MPRQRRIAPNVGVLTEGFERIRRAAGVVEEFPAAALAAASTASPDPSLARTDRRDLELLSIDPPGSRDLDQALHLARRGSGFRFTYAIADVAAFVAAGDPIDAEARRRGTTIYCPDRRVPLHPFELSEGAASLLPDQDRPAVVWTVDLDQHGEIADVHVERGLVRNRRALDYAGVQRSIDDGATDPVLQLLREVGELRIEREIARGGVSLNLPAQEVVEVDGHYELRFETKVRAEDWNAELSLCCGMAAASVMLASGVGVIRTLPSPTDDDVAQLRLSSAALGVAWEPSTPYAEWVRSLDVDTPAGAALMERAARTLRGAGYVAFASAPAPGALTHAAVNAPYAHVTAPLRRLVDRFANECVLAAAASQPRRPPGWTLDALDTMAQVMADTSRVANTVDRHCIELTEAVTLQHRVGEVFDAMVIGPGRHDDAVVQVVEPAIVAPYGGTRPDDGTWVRARLVEADVTKPSVRFGP